MTVLAFAAAHPDVLQPARRLHLCRPPQLTPVFGAIFIHNTTSAKNSNSDINSFRLCKLGEGCVADNGLSDRITLIAAHSDDIDIGSDPGQLPAKVDVIVSALVASVRIGCAEL